MCNTLKICIVLVMLLAGIQAIAREQSYILTSPDGKLVSHIVASSDDELSYDITFDGVQILKRSRLTLNRVYGTTTTDRLPVKKITRRSVDEMVKSPFYRQAEMRNHYNELTLQIKDGLWVDFRAYDEGFAYRYRTDQACTVKDELVEYNFASDWQATVPYVRGFDEKNPTGQYFNSFENIYTTDTLSQLDPRRLAFLPLVVHADNGVQVCLTESHQEHFPGLYLKGTGVAGQLRGDQAPCPDQVEQGGHNNLQEIVKTRKNWIAQLSKGNETPWRIAMVARTDTELAMNNMSYLLAPACRLNDISWIRPGKVAWDWWNCWNISGVDFVAGINNDTYKYYIDFAAQYGIEYVILDEGWAVNLKADLLQVVPEIDLPMLVKYADERGVGLILWAGYYAFKRDMENVCKHYSEMGIKGFKVDFMDSDHQAINEFYYQSAELCAKYHLLLDFHGAHIPAGINRTYPNVLNFEGVHGLENLKWAPAELNMVKYDVQIPFIRQAGGPMDYTPGAMRNAAKYCYSPIWTEPMSQGTRCHQLALYLVLDQPIAMLCDAPTEYMREPDFTRFLASIPTVWDETRILQGEVGEYIVTARRKGTTWYIGGITNWTERDLKIDLSNIVNGNHNAILYRDGTNAHRKGSDYRVEHITDLASPIDIHLAPGGGFVLKVE